MSYYVCIPGMVILLRATGEGLISFRCEPVLPKNKGLFPLSQKDYRSQVIDFLYSSPGLHYHLAKTVYLYKSQNFG